MQTPRRLRSLIHFRDVVIYVSLRIAGQRRHAGFQGHVLTQSDPPAFDRTGNVIHQILICHLIEFR